MTLGAPGSSLEARQPDVDNGLDVPEPGDYMTFSVGHEEMILVR